MVRGTRDSRKYAGLQNSVESKSGAIPFELDGGLLSRGDHHFVSCDRESTSVNLADNASTNTMTFVGGRALGDARSQLGCGGWVDDVWSHHSCRALRRGYDSLADGPEREAADDTSAMCSDDHHRCGLRRANQRLASVPSLECRRYGEDWRDRAGAAHCAVQILPVHGFEVREPPRSHRTRHSERLRE